MAFFDGQGGSSAFFSQSGAPDGGIGLGFSDLVSLA
jgi:hypothetical protein